MALEFNRTPHGVIGACIRKSGSIKLLDAAGDERPLTLGSHLRRGDRIATDVDAYAELTFLDASKLIVGELSVIELEDFFYGDGIVEDGAQFLLTDGSCLLKSGEIGNVVNGMSLQVGEIGLSVRGADIAVRMQADDYDLVSLLPSEREATGEVLVQGRFNVVVLESIFQTARLGSADADIPEPLTLPSGVVSETYAGAGFDPHLTFMDLFPENTLEFSADTPAALFRSDDNQMFDRAVAERNVYPSEDARHKEPENNLLEDSFVGERFRLDESD